MKKKTAALLTIAWMAVCLCGCAGKGGSHANGEDIKIYLSLSSADTFRTVLVDSAKETAAQNGATLDVYEAQDSIENQVAQMKQAVEEGYDVIFF